MNVVVYRSDRKADTYLYLQAGALFDDLPELLRENFPAAEAFLEIELHENRFLQQADPMKVMAAINAQGFYLQLPPPKEAPPKEASPKEASPKEA